jgi:hypothetical protein
MTPPRITEAKAIAQRIGADAVVVLAFKGDTVAGASYGQTKAMCHNAGRWMDWLIDGMENELQHIPTAPRPYKRRSSTSG